MELLMKTINYLSPERLALLPEHYYLAHEFCFYLHDSVVSTLVQYEQAGIHNTVRDAIEEVITTEGLEDKFEGKNLLDMLKDNENTFELYKKHLLGHLVLALASDMLHFLYEAMTSIEKRKFSVGFSLFRKPFKENLFLLSWILADEDDFIKRFESDNFKSFKLPSSEEKKGIIAKAISKLHTKDSFDEELIWNFIYSKQHENGFEPTWQRATHLTTSMGKLLKTEDLSFNFIFENADDDFYFNFLEDGLPYLMFYMSQVSLACFDKVHNLNEKTVNHLIMTSYGVFESLYKDEDESKVMNDIQEMFDKFLICVHCQSKFTIAKDNFASLLIEEQFECSKCKLNNQFPFYWLLAQTNLSFKE